MSGCDIGLQVKGSKAFLVRGDNRKEIPRDAVLEVYQLLLGCIASRDYTSVTSLRKLLLIIDLECQPDDSDNETEEAETDSPDEPEPEPAPKPTRAKPASKRPGRVARKTPAKPVPPESSSEEESSDSDSDDD